MVDCEATPPRAPPGSSTWAARSSSNRSPTANERCDVPSARRCDAYASDQGLSARAVSGAAGYHHSHLPRIETGERDGSLDALAALAAAMGHEVSVRLFPTDGPRVRDHLQVRMIEALLASLHPRWHARARGARSTARCAASSTWCSRTARPRTWSRARATASLAYGRAPAAVGGPEGGQPAVGNRLAVGRRPRGSPREPTAPPAIVRAMHELVEHPAGHVPSRPIPPTRRRGRGADQRTRAVARRGDHLGDIDGVGTTILRGLPRALRRTS